MNPLASSVRLPNASMEPLALGTATAQPASDVRRAPPASSVGAAVAVAEPAVAEPAVADTEPPVPAVADTEPPVPAVADTEPPVPAVADTEPPVPTAPPDPGAPGLTYGAHSGALCRSGA
jgi:hypothetical protein